MNTGRFLLVGGTVVLIGMLAFLRLFIRNLIREFRTNTDCETAQ